MFGNAAVVPLEALSPASELSVQVLEVPPALRWATAGGCIDSINASRPRISESHGFPHSHAFFFWLCVCFFSRRHARSLYRCLSVLKTMVDLM